MEAKKLYIETLGCAMNVRDSEHIVAELREKEGYELIDTLEEADLILSPVAPSVAPELGALADPLEMYKSDMYTIAVNLVGLPGISLPILKDAESGMPVGLQLIGKAFDEPTLFDGAASLERAVNYSK